MSGGLDTVSGLLGNIGAILVALKGDPTLRKKRAARKEVKKARGFYKDCKKLMMEDKVIDPEEQALLKEYRNKIYKAAIDLL